MNDLFLEVNPIPVKAAMNMMGLNVGPMRLPLCEMSEDQRRHPAQDAGGGGTAVRIILIGRGKMGTADPGDRRGRRGRDRGRLRPGRSGPAGQTGTGGGRGHRLLPPGGPAGDRLLRPPHRDAAALRHHRLYARGDGELRALGAAAPVLWSANFSLGVAVLVRALQAVVPTC